MLRKTTCKRYELPYKSQTSLSRTLDIIITCVRDLEMLNAVEIRSHSFTDLTSLSPQLHALLHLLLSYFVRIFPTK